MSKKLKKSKIKSFVRALELSNAYREMETFLRICTNENVLMEDFLETRKKDAKFNRICKMYEQAILASTVEQIQETAFSRNGSAVDRKSLVDLLVQTKAIPEPDRHESEVGFKITIRQKAE